jgi:hypothetical protein
LCAHSGRARSPIARCARTSARKWSVRVAARVRTSYFTTWYFHVHRERASRARRFEIRAFGRARVRSGGRAVTEKEGRGVKDARLRARTAFLERRTRHPGTIHRPVRALRRSVRKETRHIASRASDEGVRDRAGRSEGTRTHLAGHHLSTRRVIRTGRGRG